MTLFERISEDLKSAMLARQKERLEPLRAIKTALLMARSETGSHELTGDQEIRIIQKLVKQRKESADIFRSQNRIDLCEKELQEARIIEEYLPKQLGEQELLHLLQEIIRRVGATSVKDMGRVMAVAGKELAGRADTRLVAEKVKALLGI